MANFEQTDSELLLHQRLIQNDHLAANDVAELFLPILRRYLQVRYPSAPQDLIYDAATDAVFNYIEHPHTFDPTKKTLKGFLKMAALGDLRNELAKQHRRTAKVRLVPLEAVELFDLAGNIDIEQDYINQQEIIELRQKQAGIVEAVAISELDRQILGLLQKDERRTAAYAQVLGIEHLPILEQRQIVKQHKDRLKARLKRKPHE